MKRASIVFFAAAILFFSCNKDNTPNAAPITQHYTATYNITTGITEMRASFFYNPNNTLLPNGHSITCNGISMDREQTWYSDEVAGNPDARFALRTDDGTILENTMLSEIIPVINFDSSFTATTISRNDTLIIPFSGGPLTTGVSVSIAITQDANHYTYHHEPITIGDSVIVFLPADLTPLQSGPATITLNRIGPAWSLLESDPGGGGDMRWTNIATRAVTISN